MAARIGIFVEIAVALAATTAVASAAVVNVDFEGGFPGDATYFGDDGILSTPGGTLWNGIRGDTCTDASAVLDEQGAATPFDVAFGDCLGGFSDRQPATDLQDSGWIGRTVEIRDLLAGQPYDLAVYSGFNSGFGIEHTGGPSGGLCTRTPSYALPGTAGSDYCLFFQLLPMDLGGGVFGLRIGFVDGVIFGFQLRGPVSTPSCDLASATHVGTPGDDIIIGTAGDDVIFGMGGNDRIDGSFGNDCIDGGDGDDRLFGNRGDDRIYGGPGNDRLTGDIGDDELYGGFGNDSAFCGPGDDFASGGPGSDTIMGSVGDDALAGGDHDDVINGGTGDDTIDGGRGEDDLTGGPGNDIIAGGEGNDVIAANPGNDVANGEGGVDTVNGGPGFDSCTGETLLNCP